MEPAVIRALHQGLLAFPRPPILALAVRGEPLAHPEFPDVILQLARPDVEGKLPFRELYIDSNGLPLDGPRSRALLEVVRRLGVFVRLTVSIDAATRETYQRIRRGGDWDRLLKNLEGFLRIRQLSGQRWPAVNCQFIVMPENLPEVNECKKRFQNLLHTYGGVPRLDGKYPEHQDDTVSFVQLHPLQPEPDALQKARQIHGDVLAAMNIAIPPDTERKEKEPCVWPFYMAVVRENGDVLPCCLDTREEMLMGRLTEQPLEEIFSGSVYRKLRCGHAGLCGESVPPRCLRCPDQLVVERADDRIRRFRTLNP